MAVITNLGDKRYDSAGLISPISNYPKHAMGTPFEDIVRSLYFYSQWHSRVLIHENYGFNLRDVIHDATSVRRARTLATFFSVARARVTIPEETSHLVARFCFAVVEFTRCLVACRLSATVGATTDTYDDESSSTQFETDAIVAGGTHSGRSANQLAADIEQNPYTAGHRVYLHEVVLKLNALDGNSSSLRARVHLEAKAQRELGLAGVGLQPIWAVVTAEMRYV